MLFYVLLTDIVQRSVELNTDLNVTMHRSLSLLLKAHILKTYILKAYILKTLCMVISAYGV